MYPTNHLRWLITRNRVSREEVEIKRNFLCCTMGRAVALATDQHGPTLQQYFTWDASDVKRPIEDLVEEGHGSWEDVQTVIEYR